MADKHTPCDKCVEDDEFDCYLKVDRDPEKKCPSFEWNPKNKPKQGRREKR
jgi:hypothetical protein